jgi:NADH-quinone oxidoreductase subunit A
MSLAAYVLLFLAVGVGFVFVHLMAGALIRPRRPEPEKGTIYECGEPTIGSAWVQFDLRYYVVALLFVIFDVEVAFFFPWAEVFGKANAVAAVGEPRDAAGYHALADRAEELAPPHSTEARTEAERLRAVTPEDVARVAELKARRAAKGELTPAEREDLGRLEQAEKLAQDTVGDARALGWLALVEILVFFGVLLVGFAYLWRRGDLAWVRSVAAERPATPAELVPPPAPAAQEPPLVGAGERP